jgi:hypothetical protein
MDKNKINRLRRIVSNAEIEPLLTEVAGRYKGSRLEVESVLEAVGKIKSGDFTPVNSQNIDGFLLLVERLDPDRYFTGLRSLRTFLAENFTMNIFAVNGEFMGEINEEIEVAKKNWPKFNIKDRLTYDLCGSGPIEYFNDVFEKLCLKYKAMITPAYIRALKEERSKTVSETDLKKIVYDEMDDMSVMLMNGYISGNYDPNVNKAMRDNLYSALAADPGGKAYAIVTGQMQGELEQLKPVEEVLDAYSAFEVKYMPPARFVREGTDGNLYAVIIKEDGQHLYKITEGSEQLSKKYKDQSISTGTMVPTDLIDKYIAFLRGVIGQAGVTKEKVDEFDDSFHDAVADTEDSDELVSELVEELEDYLNYIAPEGTSFGSHTGDGADFGFWSDDEEVDENKDAKATDHFVQLDKSGIPEELIGEIAAKFNIETKNIWYTDGDEVGKITKIMNDKLVHCDVDLVDGVMVNYYKPTRGRLAPGQNRAISFAIIDFEDGKKAIAAINKGGIDDEVRMTGLYPKKGEVKEAAWMESGMVGNVGDPSKLAGGPWVTAYDVNLGESLFDQPIPSMKSYGEPTFHKLDGETVLEHEMAGVKVFMLRESSGLFNVFVNSSDLDKVKDIVTAISSHAISEAKLFDAPVFMLDRVKAKINKSDDEELKEAYSALVEEYTVNECDLDNMQDGSRMEFNGKLAKLLRKHKVPFEGLVYQEPDKDENDPNSLTEEAEEEITAKALEAAGYDHDIDADSLYDLGSWYDDSCEYYQKVFTFGENEAYVTVKMGKGDPKFIICDVRGAYSNGRKVKSIAGMEVAAKKFIDNWDKGEHFHGNKSVKEALQPGDKVEFLEWNDVVSQLGDRLDEYGPALRLWFNDGGHVAVELREDKSKPSSMAADVYLIDGKSELAGAGGVEKALELFFENEAHEVSE